MKKLMLFLVTLLISISSGCTQNYEYKYSGTFIWYLTYPDGSKRVNVCCRRGTDKWVSSYSIRDCITNYVLEDKKNIYKLAPSRTKVDSVIVSWTEIKSSCSGNSSWSCYVYNVRLSKDGKVIISDLPNLSGLEE